MKRELLMLVRCTALAFVLGLIVHLFNKNYLIEQVIGGAIGTGVSAFLSGVLIDFIDKNIKI